MMRKDCRGSFRRLAARQNAPPDGDRATKPVITKERKEKKKPGRASVQKERERRGRRGARERPGVSAVAFLGGEILSLNKHKRIIKRERRTRGLDVYQR